MTYVDSFILNVTEALCRRFQLLTGRTNVWIAVQLTNLSIVMYFVWAGVVYSFATSTPVRTFIAVFCGGLLYALTQTVFKTPIELYENSMYQRVANGLRNPRRIRDAPLRISFLTLSVLLAFPVAFVYVTLHLRVFLLTYGLVLLMTAVLYLLACDPLPRCAGTIREWVRGAVPSRLPASDASPAE
jgi:hypothetical protein